MHTAKITPFHFEEKIEVRTTVIDGEPWFCASDVCTALGYTNSRKTIADNCREKGVTSSYTLTSGGKQSLTFINEGNLYRLIIKSRKPEAQRFESWVCDEVLPAIRQHGHYQDTRGRMETLLGQTIGQHGFKMLNAVLEGKLGHLPVQQRQAANQHIWAQVHTAFGVSQGADIPAEQLDSARNFIAAYTVIEGEWLPKEPETLTPEEQHSLSEIVHRKAAPYAELQGKAQAEIWGRLHHKFRIAKYSQLPRAQLTEAIVYVGQMELRLPLTVQDESTKEQRDALQRAIQSVTHNWLINDSCHSWIHNRLRTEFNVRRLEDIPGRRVDEALALITDIKASTAHFMSLVCGLRDTFSHEVIGNGHPWTP